MKRMFVAAAAGILMLSQARAVFDPTEWANEPLATTGVTNNNWYFRPDSAKNPRILVKETDSSNKTSWADLEGGPPHWTSGALGEIAFNKQGVFVPDTGGTGYLVGLHNTLVKAAVFGSGAPVVETVDTNAGTYTGISAALDSSGNLHVGYIYNGNTLCYARRSGPSTWAFTSQALSGTVKDTAIVPNTFSDVSLYFTITTTSTGTAVTSLIRAKPIVVGGIMTIVHSSSPLVNLENFVADQLLGTRVSSTDRIFYFGSEGGSTWKFRRMVGTSGTNLETLTSVLNARSIQSGIGPDGKQRVVWFDVNGKKIHYLKPASGGDVPILAGSPVQFTGSIPAAADVLGLHFNASGTPFILYRKANDEGYVAYPTAATDPDSDLNGNGRSDLLDRAFGSATAGVEALPVAAGVTGVSSSADRFKIRFPTAGSATASGVTIESSQEALKYTVETSTDLSTWTALTGSGITYTQVSSTGTNPNKINTFVGVLPGTAPGSTPMKFARVVVTQTYPY